MQLPSRNWWLGNEFFSACYSYLSICLSIYLSIYLYAHIPYSRTIWQEQKQTDNYGGVRLEGVKVWKGAVHNALIDSNKFRYTYLKQTSLIAQFCYRTCRGGSAANWVTAANCWQRCKWAHEYARVFLLYQAVRHRLFFVWQLCACKYLQGALVNALVNTHTHLVSRMTSV